MLCPLSYWGACSRGSIAGQTQDFVCTRPNSAYTRTLDPSSTTPGGVSVAPSRFIAGRALAFPSQGGDRSIRAPVPEDVDGDLLSLTAGDLHVLLDGVALKEDEASVPLDEAPRRIFRVDAIREKDIQLRSRLRSR
jgi:hypothetical protein